MLCICGEKFQLSGQLRGHFKYCSKFINSSYYPYKRILVQEESPKKKRRHRRKLGLKPIKELFWVWTVQELRCILCEIQIY